MSRMGNIHRCLSWGGSNRAINPERPVCRFIRTTKQRYCAKQWWRRGSIDSYIILIELPRITEHVSGAHEGVICSATQRHPVGENVGSFAGENNPRKISICSAPTCLCIITVTCIADVLLGSHGISQMPRKRFFPSASSIKVTLVGFRAGVVLRVVLFVVLNVVLSVGCNVEAFWRWPIINIIFYIYLVQ